MRKDAILILVDVDIVILVLSQRIQTKNGMKSLGLFRLEERGQICNNLTPYLDGVMKNMAE